MKAKLYISTLILWIVIVFTYYLFGYPEQFPLGDVLTQQVEWKELLSIYFILILIVTLLSYSLYKNVSFSKKLFTSITCINVFLMILMLSYGGYRFYNNRKALNVEIVSFQNEAYQDIKKDQIKVFGVGLALPSRNKNEMDKFEKRDSIEKKYGLVKVSYCTISESLEICKTEYRKITEPYLEKRNGKGWREKMENEIESIK